MEYLPSCRIEDGMTMIKAFLPDVDEADRFRPADDLQDQDQFGSDPMYSVKHIALQTMDLLNKIFQ